MVARLAGELRERAARRDCLELAAADEVEPERQLAAARKDESFDELWQVCAFLERAQIDRAGRDFIIEVLPLKPCGFQVGKQWLIAPGFAHARWGIRECEQSQGPKKAQCGAAAEGVGVEVAGDDGWAGGDVLEQKLYLVATTASGAEDFEVRVCHGYESAGAGVHAHEQGVAVAGAA